MTFDKHLSNLLKRAVVCDKISEENLQKNKSHHFAGFMVSLRHCFVVCPSARPVTVNYVSSWAAYSCVDMIHAGFDVALKVIARCYQIVKVGPP